jgi:thiamine-monophosphate kinase
MTLGEFAIIERCFAHLGPLRPDVVLGVGDDAAVVRVPPGRCLASAAAVAAPGVATGEAGDPARLAREVVVQAIGRLTAAGARPAWLTLGLTLPEPKEAWLDAFSTALATIAREHELTLVGGDTTRGPLTVTVFAHGLLGEESETRCG